MAYLHVFLITVYEIDAAAEVYLELFQTYMLELFAKIVNGLKVTSATKLFFAIK